MKTCSYCGRENEEALGACGECGTEFSPVDPLPGSANASRRAFIILGLIGFAVLAIAVAVAPWLIIVLPLGALFYAPIYLPFLVSFAIKTPEWWGMKWSLRVGSVVAFFIRLDGMSRRPDFGDDVGGNIAGASHNFEWTWGPGSLCALGAVIVGLLLRALHRSKTPVSGGTPV